VIESVVLESSTSSFVSQSSLNEGSFLRALNVELWSGNQLTTEAEEVNDS
jgi:hypothetical protein